MFLWFSKFDVKLGVGVINFKFKAGDFFLGSKSVIFSLNFKNNFECQVGGVGQKIKFFVGGGGHTI